MQNIKKYFMTLALLLTAVTGAWATDGVKLTTTEIVPPAAWNNANSFLLPSDMPGLKADAITEEQAKAWADVPKSDNVDLIYGYVDAGNYIDFKIISFIDGQFNSSNSRILSHNSVYNDNVKYYYATGVVEPTIDVKWDAKAKTGSFVMPAFDVEIAPIYAPVAQWAKVDNVDQLPSAIEGIYAESTDAIVKAGTVAKMGKTENAQGTLMYAVTPATVTEAPPLDAANKWSADVPTATEIKTAGDVLVWYYIKGADTPQNQDPTAENTFNDSEICAEPLKVTVLSNKFNIQFKAANANTIEGQNGKGTVTVKTGDAEAVDKTADIDENHQLKAVKMGSEVKLEAKPGYKFRKVEVKKGGPGSLTYATKEGAVTRIKFNRSGNDYYADFTYSNGSFTRTGGTQGYGFNGSWTMKEENGVLTMTANYNEMNIQWIYFVCTFYVDTNEYTESSTGDWNISFGGIEVNGKDITDQLTKVK